MTHEETLLFLLQAAAMLAAGVAFGQIARWLKMPMVIGELFGGIVIGPTILGRLAPGFERWLFPPTGVEAIGREAVVKLGLICFLFVAGLEVNLRHVRRHGLAVAGTSIGGILLPFGTAWLAVQLAPSLWKQSLSSDHFALFLGAALAISALPVIARIILDLGFEKLPLSSIILASATIDDLLGWSLFALVLATLSPARSATNIPLTVITVIVLTLFIATVGRKWIAWARPRIQAGSRIALAAVIVILLAVLLEWIGVNAVFGAFLAGVAMAREPEEQDHDGLRQIAIAVLAPLFFVSLGLRVDFIANFNWLLVIVVIVIASAGKIAGATLGARLGGLPIRQAAAVGMAMNARGAVEMVLASIALEAKLIDTRMFVALVVMAVVTTAIAGPAMRVMLREPLECGGLPPL
jgi:Kef-type K+ transport system membrane component KefB